MTHNTRLRLMYNKPAHILRPPPHIHHCSKTVVVLCSERIRLDQNGANQVAGNWLKNQLE